MPEDKDPKLNWPKELIELLQQAGPKWSAVLGVALIAAGWKVQWLTGAGISVLAIGFLLLVSRRPSRLVRPEAFLKIREVYRGRDKESGELTAAIRLNPLLWVSGESGSGKSWLLTKGVVPSLAASSDLLPLYLNYWGTDWELGPVASLSAAFREALARLPNTPQAPKLPAKPAASELFEALERASTRLKRTPVLILDQFDDYIAANLDHLRPGGGGLIATADDLQRGNSFWREIGRLLQADAIRCVLVVRQEQGWGQGAIAFVKVREFSVLRLEGVYVDQILRELGEGAVENPERGWEQLREELGRDLYSNGGILPIQLRLVVQQLAGFRSLTVKEYRREGGVLGLSASSVNRVAERVAAATGTGHTDVLKLLTALVNPSDPSKTLDVASKDLAGFVPGTKLERVLEELQKEEMVRDRGDESGERRWRLDHDYLASAVEELDRKRNRAQRALDELVEYRRPRGWIRSVISIRLDDLRRILIGWWKGEVHPRGAWGIVAAQVLALTGFAALCAFAAKQQIDILFNDAARHYVDALDRSGDVSRAEAREWARLAEEPLQVRQRFERRMLGDDERSQRLISDRKRARMEAAALGGLSRSAADDFRLPEVQCPDRLTAACVFLAYEFGQGVETLQSRVFRDPLLSNQPWRDVDLAGFLPAGRLADSCVEGSLSEHFPIERCTELGEPGSDILKRLARAGGADVDTMRRRFHPNCSSDSRVAALLTFKLLASWQFGDAAANPQDIAYLLSLAREHNVAAAWALGVTSGHLKDEEAISYGREMLALTKSEGECYYFPGFVRTSDLRTALEALQSPICADGAAGIQRAISEAAGYRSISGKSDRWTFAREWLAPNAATYGLDPERFNTLRYTAEWLLRKWLPFPLPKSLTQ
jgi:hypothetical protein